MSMKIEIGILMQIWRNHGHLRGITNRPINFKASESIPKTSNLLISQRSKFNGYNNRMLLRRQ
jgi:hypothetical protein